MLLALLLFEIADKTAFPKVLVAPDPPHALEARLGKPIPYKLRELPKPTGAGAGKWWPDQESLFRDKKNYVGCDYVEGFVFPESPYVLTQTIKGRKRRLGWGEPVKAWWPDQILASVPVDAWYQPSFGDMVDYHFLRFYDNGVASEIGVYEFLGSGADRSLVVHKAGTLYMWSSGAFRKAVRLPDGWEPVTVNGVGDVLVRNVWGLDAYGRQSDAMPWGMGILKGTDLYPLAFSRPEQTYNLIWRPNSDDPGTLDVHGRYRFYAAWDKDVRFFELWPVLAKD